MFKNTTGYNRKLLTTFQISHMIRRQLLINVLLVIIVALMVLLVDLLALAEINQTSWIIVGLYALFLLILTTTQMLSRIKAGLKSGILRLHYDFKETSFVITASNKTSDIMEEIPYSQIKSLVKYKHVIMFYITNNKAYVMDKNGFTVGDYESFKLFIKQKISKHNL